MRFLATVGSAVTTRVTFALVAVAIGRTLGPHGLGIYATTGTIAAGLAAILDFGSPLQIQAAAGTTNSPLSLGQAIAHAYLSRAIAILLATGVSAVVGMLVLGGGVGLPALSFFAAAVAIGESGWLLTTVARCTRREGPGLVAAGLGAPLPALSVLLASRASESVAVVAAALLASQVTVVACWTVIVTRGIRLGELRWHEYVRFVKGGIPYALATVLMWVYSQSDVIVTTSLLGPTAGGAYYGNYRLFAMLTMIAIAAAAHWGPEFFAVLRSREEREDCAAFIGDRSTRLGLWGIAVALVLVAMGPLATQVLFGQRFPVFPAIHYVLAAALPAYFIGVGLGAALTSTGLQNVRTRLQAAAATLNLVLNLALMKRGGVLVGATTTTLATGTLLVLYVSQCSRLGLLTQRTMLISVAAGIVAILSSVAAILTTFLAR